MVVKWHINVYCYTMVIMLVFLLFLMIPDKTVLSQTPSDNYNKQMTKLSNDNLKASNSKDRSTITRKYNNLHKQKKMKSGDVVFNLVPLKFLLLVIMATFTYLVFQSFWLRRSKAAEKEKQ